MNLKSGKIISIILAIAVIAIVTIFIMATNTKSQFHEGKYSDKTYPGEQQYIENNPSIHQRIRNEMVEAEKELASNPRDMKYLLMLASALYNFSEYDQAEDVLQYALTVDPKQETAWSNLVEVYRSKKDQARVESTLKQWIAEREDLSEPYVKLAREYYYSNRKQEALDVLKIAAEKTKDKKLIEAVIKVINEGGDF